MSNFVAKKEFVIFMTVFVACVALLAFIYFNVYTHKGERAFYAGGGDSQEYLALADNMLAGHGFSIYREEPYEIGATRTPGYSLIIAFAKLISGEYSIFLLILFQIAALGVIGILSYRLMKKFILERAAFGLSFLVVLNPQMLFLTLAIMSDIYFILFFLSSLHAFLLFLEKKENKYFYAASLLLGSGVIVRPGGLLLFPIYLLFLIPEAIRVIHEKNILQQASAFVLGILLFLLPIFPWSLRNYIQFKTFRLSSADTYNLYYVTAPTIIGIRDGISRIEAQKTLHDRLTTLPEFTKGRAHDTFIYTANMDKEVKKIIMNSPFIFMYATLREIPVLLLQAEWATPLIKWGVLTIPDNYVSFKQSILKDGFFGFRTVMVQKFHCGAQCILPLFMLFLGALFWASISTFAAIGFFKLKKGSSTNRHLWLFVTLIVFTIVLHSMLINVPTIPGRYKLPILPLLFIFAWYGWEKTKTLSKRLTGGRVVAR